MRSPPRRASPSSSALALALAHALGAAACDGVVGATGASERLRTPPGVEPGPSSSATPPTPDTCRERLVVADSSRAPRLSHAQWERTVQDLLQLAQPSNLSQSFTPDGELGADLFVDDRLWSNYQRAAETLAQQASATRAAVARLLPAGAPTTGAAGAQAFVSHVGRRALRRPLSEDERARYLTLFNAAAALFPGRDAYLAGVDLVLRALLQSPGFLYRLELSDARVDGVAPLDDYEVASRLSYAVLGSMPDEALFTAAERGELRAEAGVRAQVTRLLADPRARGLVTAFHRRYLHLDGLASIAPDPGRIPIYRESMRASMEREFELFVEHLTFTERGGFASLLTADYSFANADIAAIYGLAGSFDATSYRRVTLPPQRAGVLTQSAFLAAHGGAYHPDTIHRGVRLTENVLCVEIGDPPDGIPPLPAEMRNTTNRQRVTAHTNGSACTSCHSVHINPLGFSLENFDAVGRFRTVEEGGLTIDATGAHEVDGQRVAFDGPVPLVRAIAGSAQGHRCYVRHWVRQLAGRPATAQDECLLRRVGDESRAGLSITDLIASVLASPELRVRP